MRRREDAKSNSRRLFLQAASQSGLRSEAKAQARPMAQRRQPASLTSSFLHGTIELAFRCGCVSKRGFCLLVSGKGKGSCTTITMSQIGSARGAALPPATSPPLGHTRAPSPLPQYESRPQPRHRAFRVATQPQRLRKREATAAFVSGYWLATVDATALRRTCAPTLLRVRFLIISLFLPCRRERWPPSAECQHTRGGEQHKAEEGTINARRHERTVESMGTSIQLDQATKHANRAIAKRNALQKAHLFTDHGTCRRGRQH